MLLVGQEGTSKAPQTRYQKCQGIQSKRKIVPQFMIERIACHFQNDLNHCIKGQGPCAGKVLICVLNIHAFKGLSQILCKL